MSFFNTILARGSSCLICFSYLHPLKVIPRNFSKKTPLVGGAPDQLPIEYINRFTKERAEKVKKHLIEGPRYRNSLEIALKNQNLSKKQNVLEKENQAPILEKLDRIFSEVRKIKQEMIELKDLVGTSSNLTKH